MCSLHRPFRATLLQYRLISTCTAISNVHKAPVRVSQQSKVADHDQFGSLAAKEVLSSESLPDDDDNYDKLEKMKRRRPIQHYDMYFSRLKYAGGPEKMKKAIEAFERMQREDRHEPEMHHITLMISGCAEFGLLDKAFYFFQLLLKMNRKPTKAGLTSLLNACAEARDRDKGLEKLAEITQWIRETSYPCNVIQYNAMVKAYARLGDLKSAFAVGYDMRKEGHEWNDTTFCMLLMGCVSDRESGFCHAVRVLKEMRSRMPVSVHAVNLFLRVVRDCGVGTENHLRKLFSCAAVESVTFLPPGPDRRSVTSEVMLLSPVDLVREKFAKHKVCLDLSTLGSASNRLLLVGGSAGVFSLLDESKVKPSVQTITTLLSCIPSCTEAEEDLVKAAESRGVTLDTAFFNVLIKKRAFRSDLSAARSVLVDIQRRSLPIDIVTFGTLALTCRSRRVGLQLMEDMRNAGFKLNKEISGSLICSASFAYDFEYLTAVLQAMQVDAVRPDPKMLEVIEAAKLSAERALVKLERGQALEKYRQSLTNASLDRFKLFYKSWCRRSSVDFPVPEERQFDFQISPEPRQKMFEFEREMRQRISDVRGYRFRTAPRVVDGVDVERALEMERRNK